MERIRSFAEHLITLILLAGAIRPVIKALFDVTVDELLWPGKLNDLIDVPFYSFLGILVYLHIFKPERERSWRELIHIKISIALLALLSACLLETSQALGWMDSLPWFTYDPWDFVAYFCGFFLVMALLFVEYASLRHKSRYLPFSCIM